MIQRKTNVRTKAKDIDSFDADSSARSYRSSLVSRSHKSYGESNSSSYHQKIGGGLKFKDTISELYDRGDKDAVYQSSMKKGGAVHDFNQTLGRGRIEDFK